MPTVDGLLIEGLDAFYGESQILHGVSIRVPLGARIAIVGRNGAGKSTLFKSIMNAGPITRGQIVWLGESLGRSASFERTRKGLALVPEDRRIFSHVTVRENIAMSRYGAAKGQALPADEVIARFPMLIPVADRPGNALSGGQQQMVAIARAIAARPKLLLLDEPTEGLAPVIVEQLAADVISACKQTGAALLLTEQNLWFARRCTDWVYVIDSGQIVFDGDWPTLQAHPQIKERYLAV